MASLVEQREQLKDDLNKCADAVLHLLSYLHSDKFRYDTTVQVQDVLLRLADVTDHLPMSAASERAFTAQQSKNEVNKWLDQA